MAVALSSGASSLSCFPPPAGGKQEHYHQGCLKASSLTRYIQATFPITDNRYHGPFDQSCQKRVGISAIQGHVADIRVTVLSADTLKIAALNTGVITDKGYRAKLIRLSGKETIVALEKE